MDITVTCAEITVTFPGGSASFNKEITTTEIVVAQNPESEDRVYLNQNSANAPLTFWWNLEKAIECGYGTLQELYDFFVTEIASQCGGGSQTLSISNDILSISNGNSIVLPTGASTLFPNGVKLVLSSRDFQADDKDFVLYCPVPGTIITMPTTNPFSEGDYIGVVMSSPDSYFETYNNGSGGTDKMYPYTANPSGTPLEQQSSSEVVILRALNQGTLWILPLCGAVKYSVDISGSNFKTLARYNYDESQNAIPLSGTVSGSPVTGDIEVFNGFDLKTPNADANEFHSLYMDDGGVQLKYNDGVFQNEVSISQAEVFLNSTNPAFTGLKGQDDYSSVINDLNYTQKIYVGFRGTATLSSGTVTVTTDKIKTGYKIYLSVNTPSGTQGFLSAPTGSIVDETEFVINSTSATDDSTVNWWIAP